MKRTPSERKKLVARLKRVEGQVAAVRRMVEADAHCPEVLTQIAAARGALGKVGQVLLRDHVAHCVTDAIGHGDEAERRASIDELMDIVGRFSGLGGK